MRVRVRVRVRMRARVRARVGRDDKLAFAPNPLLASSKSMRIKRKQNKKNK